MEFLSLSLILTKDEELDLPSIFKQRYNAGFAKSSRKPFFKSLTSVLSAVITGLQSYCDTYY